MSSNQSQIRNPKSEIAVGCQGWNYPDWTTKAGGDTAFYPRGTRAAEMLEIYAGMFDTVEVDSTFYAVPAAATVESWYERTPAEFLFSLKMPQEITHVEALRPNAIKRLDEFCERAALLKEKLAAILIQLPPQFDASSENLKALREFLPHLPKDVRFAVEFRDRGWFDHEVFELLTEYNVALCFTDGTQIPRAYAYDAMQTAIADFAYVRFMGERDLTRFDAIQREQTTNLRLWSEEIQKLTEKATRIYVYFSNFYEGHAPASANKLKKLLRQQTVEPNEFERQNSLF